MESELCAQKHIFVLGAKTKNSVAKASKRKEMKTNSFTLENPMTPPVNLLEDKDVEMQDVENTVRHILYINSFTNEINTFFFTWTLILYDSVDEE